MDRKCPSFVSSPLRGEAEGGGDLMKWFDHQDKVVLIEFFLPEALK